MWVVKKVIKRGFIKEMFSYLSSPSNNFIANMSYEQMGTLVTDKNKKIEEDDIPEQFLFVNKINSEIAAFKNKLHNKVDCKLFFYCKDDVSKQRPWVLIKANSGKLKMGM